MHQDIIARDVEEIICNVNLDLFDDLAGKTMLVTGPKGLLAGYVVDTIAYLNDNYLVEPCMVIGLHRGIEYLLKKEFDRLEHLSDREDIVLIEHDVSEPFTPDEDTHIDFIVHAAGRSAPSYFVQHPVETIDINITALRWLLDLAVEHNVESFAYFSSGEIYGSPPDDKIPTPETYSGCTSTTGTRACYTESKRCGEALCLAFHKEHSVPVKILRPVLVYGPGLSLTDGRVMAEFMNSAINGKEITMADEGKSVRNYCYIIDAMVMFWKIFLSDKNGDVFNIGSQNEPVSIRELAGRILKICAGTDDALSVRKEDLEFIKSAPNRVCLDMSKVKELFGYEAKTPMEEGLRRTIEWNRRKYNL